MSEELASAADNGPRCLISPVGCPTPHERELLRHALAMDFALRHVRYLAEAAQGGAVPAEAILMAINEPYRFPLAGQAFPDKVRISYLEAPGKATPPFDLNELYGHWTERLRREEAEEMLWGLYRARDAEEQDRREWIAGVKARLGLVTIGNAGAIPAASVEWPAGVPDGPWKTASVHALELPGDWPPGCRCVLADGERVSLGGPCPAHPPRGDDR